MELRIDYDDDALSIIDNVNRLLESYGLVFMNDEQEHDGFEIYTLEEIEEDI